MAELPWPQLQGRLRSLFESGALGDAGTVAADAQLAAINLLGSDGALTELAEQFAMTVFVLQDDDGGRSVLGQALAEVVPVRQFCAALWPHGPVPVAGAVSFLRRLMKLDDDTTARRWLELMSRGRLVAYNRSSPQVRVLFNPDGLGSSAESASLEQAQARMISPETPFGNVRALKGLLESATGVIRWYEQHMPSKVMEVLYESIAGEGVSGIRLLSGPANITPGTRSDFKRFRAEMDSKRSVSVEWRVLDKKRSQEMHDRFFMADSIAVNLPPLNSILRGSTGEILPSAITLAEFDGWWREGADILTVALQDSTTG